MSLVRPSDIIECLCAAHLGHLVEGPFQERGGIMLVGPPAALKTTMVSVLDKVYPDAIMLSDINVKSLMALRDAIAAGRINTLVLPELAKLYERHNSTASNIEGTLRSLAGEGFSAASFEDSRIQRAAARCVVIGALTPATLGMRFDGWNTSGFARRFLWSMITLQDPFVLERAAMQWQRIEFRVRHTPVRPEQGPIPNLLTPTEQRGLSMMVKYQIGEDHALQLQILQRIYAVLKWWYGIIGDTTGAWPVVERFGHTLQRTGALLSLTDDEVQDSTPVSVASAAARQLARARWRGEAPRKPARKKR